MKIVLSIAGASVLMACAASAADAVTEQNSWQHTYPVTSTRPQLKVRNISGSVTVRAGTTREIIVSINERRSAFTRSDLEESKARLQLHTEASTDGVSFIVEDADRDSNRTDLCRGCRVEYQFDITVPADARVDVSTVTDGRVEVQGVNSLVNASNVNGPVAVHGLTDCTKIESVNGSLNVSFARAPDENCALKTINGDITIGLPAAAGLNALLSVTHGSIESEFDIEPLTVAPKVERQQRDESFLYRVDQKAGVRLGSGGPTFTFASLNGDIRFIKNK